MDKKTKVHFIGINGSGISGVACIAKKNGFDVSGCDANAVGSYTKQLLENDITVSVGHDKEHIKNVDIVVLSPALLYKDKYKTIEETKVAMETKPTIKWQKFLGEYIMKNQNVVAIAGTHGKTTTTTMVGLLLEKANFDPTVFVGGIVKEWNTTFRTGDSNYYVCEGDEYDGNFLHYNPKYVILNNIEMEHPELFPDYETYENNFRNFLKTIQKNGKLIFNFDDENSLNLINSMKEVFKEKNIELVGLTYKKNIETFDNIKIVYVNSEKNNIYIENNVISHKLLGKHNSKNIAIASVLALEIGININTIKEFFSEFNGAGRRMDLVYSSDKIKLYDDYAHHHTQVDCVLKALKENLNTNEKIIAILEPHLISRIVQNTQDYKNAMLLSDFPIITKIFKSREAHLPDIDVKALINDEKIKYIEEFDEIIKEVKNIISNTTDKINIIVMGAGNSYKLTTALKEVFENK